MENNLYFEIIKKQQELINLMLSAGIVDAGTKQSISSVLPEQKLDFKGENSKNQVQKFDCDGFCQWMKRKGISQNGIDSYKYTVNEFFAKYGVLNVDTLAEYERYLKDNRSPKTVNLRIAGMNKYFKYINFTGYEFVRVKEQKRTFCDNAINEVQYTQLLNWSKNNNVKVWLIAKVISGTGVRVSELIELKTIDLDNGYADITGKGGKQRRIYFPSKLVNEIKDKCGKEFVIENRYGAKITTRGVSQLLINAAEKAGIPKEVMHPHSFRHYFAKQFMKKTQDISLLGDLLGHSNISTTAIYTRLTSEEQKNEINKLINWV